MTEMVGCNAPATALGIAQAGQGIEVPGFDPQRLRARLDIFDEAIVMTRYDNEEHAVSSYEVAPAALAAAFTGVPVATGLLPQNTLFYGDRDGRVALAVYLPPEKRTLSVDGESYTFTMPPLVFGGCDVQYQVFSVKQYPSQGSERLFHAPLPNVHPWGEICEGTVKFPVCAPGTIYRAVEMFLASGFQGHLLNHKSKAHPDNVMLAWADAGDAYPLDDLLRSGEKLEDLWTSPSQ